MLWTTNIYLCAPVYNAHPHFEACFHKKAFQRHSCRKIIFWKNSAEMSNLAIPARKSVTGVDANHLMFCLFSDTSCFMMFSSAVLLLHDRTRSICTTLVAFLWRRSPGTRLAATWEDSLWRCEEDLHDFFYFKSFRICSKNYKISEWIVLLQSLKENSSWNLLCHRNTSLKYSRKCNRFLIVIVNKLHDWCHWHWRTWTKVM